MQDLCGELLLFGAELTGIDLYHIVVKDGFGFVKEPLIFVQKLDFLFVELLVHIHCDTIIFYYGSAHAVDNLSTLLKCY